MININLNKLKKLSQIIIKRPIVTLIVLLTFISVASFIFHYFTGLGLLYNDARSHLDISRRVVENLTPGLAQLGSVWLPLPHFLMLTTIWNDFMWHSGLSGALLSMLSYIITGVIIYLFLKELKVGIFGRLMGTAVFALNLNIIYMQSTAMTELLLIATMTAAVYDLYVWQKNKELFRLIRVAFWILLSTLVRYDGWLLFIFAAVFVFFHSVRSYGYKKAEGIAIIFVTLAGFGIFLWFFWNIMIFKDPLYFAFGPYSANSQQAAMEQAGALPTKNNLGISFMTYSYALIYNTNPFFVIIALTGFILFVFDKTVSAGAKSVSVLLLVPFIFNVLALFLGHSSLYVKDIIGSWFNVRYGLMMIPTVALFVGYFTHRLIFLRGLFLGLFILITFFSFTNYDAVSLDDAVFGSSGKNVKEVSTWLKNNAAQKDGFVLISVASHDAIIFSSGLPMSRFIHEGTGAYWAKATRSPEKWARWIIMRTHDNNDLAFKLLKNHKGLAKYSIVNKYPFADIYEIKPEFINTLNKSKINP